MRIKGIGGGYNRRDVTPTITTILFQREFNYAFDVKGRTNRIDDKKKKKV